MLKKTKTLVIAGMLAITPFASSGFAEEIAKKDSITVYKSASCGCCAKWVSIMEKNGFDVKVVNSDNMQSIKSELNVPLETRSCHTAVTQDGYFVEGHVPPEIVRAMIDQKPDIAGIATPGMPLGSPGMEMPGMSGDPYPVLSVERGG